MKLLVGQAPTSTVNDNGETALHIAVGRGDALVRFLAENGARLDIKDKFGRTPLDVAMGVPGGAGGGRGRGRGAAGTDGRSRPREHSRAAQGADEGSLMLGRRLLLVLVALFVSSCGSSSPTTPSSSPPVSGAWIGHSTLTSVSGGECVGNTLAAAVGSRDIFSARIQQDESELAASLTYQGNRTSCVYRGEHGERGPEPQLHLVPGWTHRDVCLFERRRPSARDRRHSGVRPEQRDERGRAPSTTTLNVYAAGSSSPVSVLTVSSSEFRWNVLGIPHNDFHIFDGSILPGCRWSHHHPGGYDPVLHEVRVVLTRSPALVPGPRSA